MTAQIAMRRVPKFQDAFLETLEKNVASLPDRSALEAWQSFDLNFIANPFKQMAEADLRHMTAQQLLVHLKKMAATEERPLHEVRREYDRRPLEAPGGAPGPPGPPGPPGAPLQPR